MKAAIIHPRFTESFGGTKKVCLETARILEQQGYEVEVYWEHGEAREQAKEVYDTELGDNVDFCEISESFTARFFDKKMQLLQDIRNHKVCMNKAIDADQDEEVDLIVFTAGIRKFGCEFDTPTIQYTHRYLDEDWSQKILPYRKLLKSMGREGFFKADKNFTNSPYVANKLNLDAEELYPPVELEYEALPWRDRRHRAVIAGRIERDKNIEEAIEIIEKTDLDLLIMGLKGSEKYYQELEQKVNDKDFVEIKSNLLKEKYIREMKKSKIGISCKREENFGITTLEYLKNGLIPMVYNNAGPKFIVDNENFTYKEVEEASEKIQQNLQNSDQRLNEAKERSENFDNTQFLERIKQEIKKNDQENSTGR